ncbi:MAG: hypothetical protein RL398_979 [Planctomycetota bacterium]
MVCGRIIEPQCVQRTSWARVRVKWARRWPLLARLSLRFGFAMGLCRAGGNRRRLCPEKEGRGDYGAAAASQCGACPRSTNYCGFAKKPRSNRQLPRPRPANPFYAVAQPRCAAGRKPQGHSPLGTGGAARGEVGKRLLATTSRRPAGPPGPPQQRPRRPWPKCPCLAPSRGGHHRRRQARTWLP